MHPQFTRFIQLCLMAAAVAALLAVRFSPAARAIVAEFWAPAMEAREALDEHTREASRFSKTKIELIREIETLEAELQDQARRQSQAALWRQENTELRGLLNAPAQPGYRYAIAHVVTRDPASGGRRLRLDVGSADGLLVGQAVTARGFLLGRILETSPHSAVVVTIADPNCQIGAEVEIDGHRLEGILVGRGRDASRATPYCLLTHLPRDEAYREDLLVQTSGYSRVIPPGLPIGLLARDPPGDLVELVDSLYKNATVAPFVFDEDYRFVSVWIRAAPEPASPRQAAVRTDPVGDIPAEPAPAGPQPIDPNALPDVPDTP